MPSAENILDEIIKSERLAHAYIFFGSQKKIMVNTAMKFAKALNCLNKNNRFTSCDECLSCRKIEHFNHPDIGHIRPDENSPQIKIEQIRDFQRDVYLRPIEAEEKVYIIYDADSMTEEAANCLLKTLEEPPRDVIIVLISSKLGSFSPTIISRCQIIRFSQSDYAEESYGEEAALISEFLDAQDSFSSDGLEFVKRPKDEQLRTLDLLLVYFRGALLYKFLKNNFSDAGRIKDIRRVSERYTTENILALMQEFLKAKSLLESNVNSKMVADFILGNIFSLKGTVIASE